jgi:hypothetical protein
MNKLLIILLVFFSSCQSTKKMHWPHSSSIITGNDFYHQAFAMQWKERDSFATKEILSGNVPSFLKKFIGIHISVTDSLSGKSIKAVYYVAPDYLSIGNNDDWARIPITPMAAQKIADNFQCFLPTRKMVDDIYKAAKIKGQRKGKNGLIAGIKKDVVISGKISRDSKPDREAIYGWHKSDGKPIQPLYTGHINWWVDYSHGIRLVYRKIKVGNKWMDYTDVLKDTILQKLLCDEEYCDFFRYVY